MLIMVALLAVCSADEAIANRLKLIALARFEYRFEFANHDAFGQYDCPKRR